jgi:hypothetical protein
MASPLPMFAILCAYLYFVLEYGPKYMKEKKPYSLNTIIRVYNISQIICCICIFYLVSKISGLHIWYAYIIEKNFNYNTIHNNA